MLEKLRLEHTRLMQTQGNFLDNLVKMPEGEGAVVIRILPPREGEDLFCLTRIHRINNKNIHCPKTLNHSTGRWEGFCPICNHYSDLWRKADQRGGEEAQQLINAARAIKPIERAYYNCIQRSLINANTQEVEKDVGPLILAIGKQIHQKVIKAFFGDPTTDEPELGDVTHPEDGRDFKIIKKLRKTGPVSYPNYDESKFLQVSPLGTAKQINQWMNSLHDLKALRQVKSVAEIKQELDIFLGLAEDPAVSFSPQEEEKPSSKPMKTPVYDDGMDESFTEDEFLTKLRNIS